MGCHCDWWQELLWGCRTEPEADSGTRQGLWGWHRDHGGEQGREGNGVGGPWGQCVAEGKGSTRERGNVRRRSPGGAQGPQGSVLVTGVTSCRLALVPIPFPGQCPVCALRARGAAPAAGQGQRGFGGGSCTEPAPAGFDGLHEPCCHGLIHIHSMRALHSPKTGLPGFPTFNRHSVWLCVVLTRQITHILQAGGSLILILCNSGFCLLTNSHFLL